MSNQITGKEDVVVAILTDILSALNDIKYEMSGYNEETREFDVRCLEEYTSRIDRGCVCGSEVTLEDLKNMDKHKNSEFKANITAYKDVDGVARIEYKNHIIQIYGYVDDNEMINNCYFIINENSQAVREKFCIVEAFQHIDKLVGDV